MLKNTRPYLFLRRLYTGWRMLTLPYSYLRTTGFIKSHLFIKPLDQKGRPVPWMNYAMVEFLNQRLHKEMRVFEYGSGFSTQYFAERVGSILALESDGRWKTEVEKMLRDTPNAEVIQRTPGEYYEAAAAENSQKYDLIINDGLNRVKCARYAWNALTPEGVLLLDDSDRDEYREVFQMAEERGFKSLTISGIKPFSFKREETTIFYRTMNTLNI